jgi:asparagine synthase (glutamine-hydrolysing)
LEARVQFLDVEFFDYYMKLSPVIKMPFQGMEKYLIRKAFEVVLPDLLCKEVLWRAKEAFSDGVSKHVKSWYEIIQDDVETFITNKEYNDNYTQYTIMKPVSKESYYYRKIYEQYYPNRENVISHFWLPNWSGNIKEPSARVLKVYEA